MCDCFYASKHAYKRCYFTGREPFQQGEDVLALAAVLPPDVNVERPISYLRHLVTLFDKTSNAAETVYFARLAISQSDPADTQDLWFKCHKALLDLGLYEDAYAVMASTPFHELLSLCRPFRRCERSQIPYHQEA